MWCRAIVAAIALSYVICVLLLSGLQKESLDAGMLEKLPLPRHNVNIHDMSNEDLRQECSMKVLSSTPRNAQNYEMSDDETPVKQLNKSKFSAEDIQCNKVSVDETKREVLSKEHTSLIKIFGPNNEPIKYVNKEPSLETMLQFWNKFSYRGKTGSIPETTTIKEKVDVTPKNSNNEGYIHSKEMDYINRILTDYLASKTIPTTTQRLIEKDKKEDISKNINQLLDKHKKINPMTVWNTMVNVYNKTDFELNDLVKFESLGKNNYNARESKVKPQHISERESISQTLPIIANAKTVDRELEQKMEALKYLNDIFRLGSAFNLNIPVSSTETTKQYAIKNNVRDNQKMPLQYTEESNGRTSRPAKKREEINNKFKYSLRSVIDIDSIADRVKEMVMRDIRNNNPFKVTTTPASSIRTTIKSMTEKPTTSSTETKEKNLMIQTLMDVFEEFKKKQKTPRATTEKLLITTLDQTNLDSFKHLLDRILPPVMNGKNASGLSNIRQFNPGNYQVPMPLGPAVTVLQRIPYIPAPNIYDLRAPPITIQSNAAEIPPLFISVPKPIKLVSHPIILTTLNPLERQRHERLQSESKNQLNGKFSLDVDTEIDHMDINTYDVLQKKLRTAEAEKKEFRDFYKDRIQQLKKRTQQFREHNDRNRVNTPSDTEYQLMNRYSKAEPRHREFDKDVGLTIKKYFGTPESHENFDRPVHNKYYSLNRPQSSSYYDTLSQPLDYNQDGPQPEDPHYHKVLSRQRGPNQRHSGRFIQSSPYVGRPIKTEEKLSQTSYDRDEYEHGKYKPRLPKFHDELEHTQNRSEKHKHRQGSSDCCRAVPTRDQIPMTRIKHPKHDDTHFKHFLASQQKVTDMLEKLLATYDKKN